jgi:hypothetical protein
MWNPMPAYDGSPPTEPDDDFTAALNGSKAVPCNTHAYFDIIDNALNMTVCNRSNDMVWGMMGANVVHFSMLQEYLACCLNAEVGNYHQITNNLHVYTNNWDPETYLSGTRGRDMHSPKLGALAYAASREDQTVNGGVLPGCRLVSDKLVFDREVQRFIDDPYQSWKEPFLESVAKHYCQAFKHHKARQYSLAFEALNRVQAGDWHLAGYYWLMKRKQNWEATKMKEATNAAETSAS